MGNENSRSSRVDIDQNTYQNQESKMENRRKTFMKKLTQMIKTENKADILKQLSAINTSDMEALNETVKTSFKGETLLHIAISNDNSNNLRYVENLLQKFPDQDILIMKREGTDFEGQTALHVAIVQSNFKAVEMLLKYATSMNKKENLLQIRAHGKQFKNTALMGQLPLSVAALMMKEHDCLDTERFKTVVQKVLWRKEGDSCRKKIFDLLLAEGACLWEKNDHGDTVFHSLIKYGEVFHEKILHVKAAFSYVWQRFRDETLKTPDDSPFITDILFWENNEGLTPLQLSAKLGVGEVFDYIVNLSDVYRFHNVQDGLFDVRVYDITEFDRSIQYLEEQDDSEINIGESGMAAIKRKRKPGKITILERLFDPQCKQREAFEILNQKLVRYILQTKWKTYRIPLFFWLITHFFFMIFTTVVTVRKSDVLICSKENQTSSCELGENGYAVGVMFLLIGLVYLAFSFLLIYKLIVRLYNGGLGLLRHNLDYISCLTVVSICAIIESILSFQRSHCDIHLVFLLICGWYFMLYFSPFDKNIVSFTYMMKSGFVEDFLPFSLSFLLLLLPFTTAMHVLFRGIDEHPEEFDSFRDSLLTMFKLGVGLNDISVLNQSRIPWLAYTLFILFAILCFIHLLNALIAIMSQTFSDVHQERKSHLNYQKLCMIEFFEDILLTPFFKNIVSLFKKDIKYWTEKEITYGPAKRQIKIKRYTAKIHSLDNSFYNRDGKEKRKESKLDLPNFNEVIHLQNNVNSEQEVMNDQDVTFIRFVEKRHRSSQCPEVQHSST